MRCPNCLKQVEAKIVEKRTVGTAKELPGRAITREALLQCPACKVQAREFTWANAGARYEEEFGTDDEEDETTREELMKDVTVQEQGTVIVERDGDGFLMMFPDGTIEGAGTRRAVDRKAKIWFAKHLNEKSIGVGRIEWRIG